MYGGLLSDLLLPCNSSDCTTGRRVYMAEGSQLIPGFTQFFSSVSKQGILRQACPVGLRLSYLLVTFSYIMGLLEYQPSHR